MNVETPDRKLSTADLLGASERSVVTQASAPDEVAQVERETAPGMKEERLAALFAPDAAQAFQKRWDEVQIGFVDDPTQAVQRADELVAQVMRSLAETFSSERAKLEGEDQQNDQVSTENLRVALRHYRSFFQRLLSL